MGGYNPPPASTALSGKDEAAWWWVQSIRSKAKAMNIWGCLAKTLVTPVFFLLDHGEIQLRAFLLTTTLSSRRHARPSQQPPLRASAAAAHSSMIEQYLMPKQNFGLRQQFSRFAVLTTTTVFARDRSYNFCVSAATMLVLVPDQYWCCVYYSSSVLSCCTSCLFAHVIEP